MPGHPSPDHARILADRSTPPERAGEDGNRPAARSPIALRRKAPQMNHLLVPRHEPEVIEAMAAKHYRGDDEKVATTSINHLIVCGVKITSRYQKAVELDLMRALILALPSPFCGMVESIWCDSKACCCYSVVLREWLSSRAFSSAAEIIGSCLETTLRSMRPFGHNGIDISDAKQFDRAIYLNPNWGDGA